MIPNPKKYLTFYFRRIQETKNELEASNYFSETINSLKESSTKIELNKDSKILCFGLGHFSSCSTSRFQLAYILLIKEHFNIKSANFSDPIFSSQEKLLLETLNCQLIAENLEGKFQIENNNKTIFYLPHCPKQLTNNILWKNWGLQLQNIILIGNSFDSLICSTPERILKSNAEFILKINPFVRELFLENNFKFSDIFNDTSIHLFEKDKIENIEIDFWENISEPIYKKEDTEFITK